MKKQVHTLNGKLVGVWYYLSDFLADDIVVYLMHAKQRDLNKGARPGHWYFQKSLIAEARSRNCERIGVVCASKPINYYWLTSVDLLERFGKPLVRDGIGYLEMPAKSFIVRPDIQQKHIQKSIRIGR